MSTDISVNSQNIVLNLVHPKSSHIINFIVLIAKFVIYRAKCNNVLPTIFMIKNEIDLYYEIESFIAVKNNEIKRHEHKWEPYTKR